MRDPLPRNSNSKFNTGGFQHYSGSGYVNKGSISSNNNGSMQVKRNKSDYCWNFNKGIPCKFGAKCKFIERCKYCDSPSHGVNSCFKLQKKEGVKMANSTANSNNSNSNNSQPTGAGSK